MSVGTYSGAMELMFPYLEEASVAKTAPQDTAVVELVPLLGRQVGLDCGSPWTCTSDILDMHLLGQV